MEQDLPEYSARELSLKNGQDSPEIWVSYKGIIYDITHSQKWFRGMHYQHWSGQDLTDEMKDAPHPESVFLKFKAIGKLKK